VATIPANGQRKREGLASAPSPSHTLLVVEPLQWHIRLKNRLQRAYVDPDFHRRRDRQQVDLLRRPPKSARFFVLNASFTVNQNVAIAVSTPPPVRQKDPPEIPLTLRAIVSLTREFFAVEAVSVSCSPDLSSKKV